MATAVACSTAAGGPVDWSQIFWPEGTVAPWPIGAVALASENMLAPVAVTVVGASESTVKGPRTDPGGPFKAVGVMRGSVVGVSGSALWL